MLAVTAVIPLELAEKGGGLRSLLVSEDVAHPGKCFLLWQVAVVELLL